MSNLGGGNLGESEDGKTASIRMGQIQYEVRCQKRGPQRRAVIQIESRNNRPRERDSLLKKIILTPSIGFNWLSDPSPRLGGLPGA
jgi:hypothetical protein